MGLCSINERVFLFVQSLLIGDLGFCYTMYLIISVSIYIKYKHIHFIMGIFVLVSLNCLNLFIKLSQRSAASQ